MKLNDKKIVSSTAQQLIEAESIIMWKIKQTLCLILKIIKQYKNPWKNCPKNINASPFTAKIH